MTTLGTLATWTADALYLMADALDSLAAHLLERGGE